MSFKDCESQVQHWDDMELIWRHVYSEMKAPAARCRLLFFLFVGGKALLLFGGRSKRMVKGGWKKTGEDVSKVDEEGG